MRSGIGGKEDAVEGMGFEAGAQGGIVEGTVEREQAADAGKGKAHAEGDGGKVGGGDEHEQGEAGRGVGQAGSDEADGGEREPALEAQGEDAGILAALGVEVQEAAAADGGGVDLQPDAVGGFEAEVKVSDAEIAAVLGEREGAAEADTVDHSAYRADRYSDAGRRVREQAGIARLQAQVNRRHGHYAADRHANRQCCIQAACAAKGQSLIARPD